MTQDIQASQNTDDTKNQNDLTNKQGDKVAHEESQTTEAQETRDEMNDAMRMLELEKSIKTFHQGIAMKQQELRKHKEMIKDTLDGDATYVEHDEKVKEAKRVLKQTQDQLLSIDSIISTKEDMKELSAEIRELRTLLSQRLVEYYEVTDQRSITMDDGETYVIQTSAKLVKQK